jgi:hypothetical protein
VNIYTLPTCLNSLCGTNKITSDSSVNISESN